MRLGAIILLNMTLSGCAAKPSPPLFSNQPPRNPFEYEAVSASALVFDAPVANGELPVELCREDRAPSAFVSFEEPSITTYWIHTDDWQQSHWGGDWGSGWGGDWGSGAHDSFERRAIIDKTGVTYR